MTVFMDSHHSDTLNHPPSSRYMLLPISFSVKSREGNSGVQHVPWVETFVSGNDNWIGPVMQHLQTFQGSLTTVCNLM